MAALWDRFKNLWRNELMDRQQVQIKIGQELLAAQQHEPLERLAESGRDNPGIIQGSEQQEKQKEDYRAQLRERIAEQIGPTLSHRVDFYVEQYWDVYPGLDDRQLVAKWDQDHQVTSELETATRLAVSTTYGSNEQAQLDARTALRNELRAQYGTALSAPDEQRISQEVHTDFAALRDEHPGMDAVELLALYRAKPAQSALQREVPSRLDMSTTYGTFETQARRTRSESGTSPLPVSI
jgi:hypothetical protein